MDPVSRRLAALFVVGVLLFFSPILAAVNRPGSIAGIPSLPLYLFGCWAVLVVAAALAVRRGPR